ncbi:MAG: glycine zipper domain-containing protein [Phycisphaerales bacterium]|nr:glycine zipper domain-containing protein [Phycisphaerales bacterium]
MQNSGFARRTRFAGYGVAMIAAGVFFAGCRNDAGTFAAVGSALGAGAGAIIGHQSGHGAEGALIGAGAGALGGYILGNESDKHKMERYDPNYDY